MDFGAMEIKNKNKRFDRTHMLKLTSHVIKTRQTVTMTETTTDGYNAKKL